MSEVKCAIGGEKIDTRKAYWCPDCQMWVCYNHAKTSVFSNPKCPHCNKELKKGSG